MPNNSNRNETNAKPKPVPEGKGGREDRAFEVTNKDEIPLEELHAPLAEGEPLEKGDGPLPSPDAALPALSESISFDVPVPTDDSDSGALTMGVSLDDLPELPDVPLSSADHTADIAAIPDSSNGSSVFNMNAIGNYEPIGNLEPIAPVEPASGWLDADTDETPKRVDPDRSLPSERLEVNQADLFEAPPTIDSSDIFNSGPISLALGADQSDVISATAYGSKDASSADEGDRPSEVELAFDSIPDGSSLQQGGGASGELPMAEELADSADVIGRTVPPSNHSGPQGHEIPNPEEFADFGSTPLGNPDASSILSDLSDPGEIAFDEASAVRLDSPGVGRTLNGNPGDAVEFDLTIPENQIHPELDAAEVDSTDGESVDWQDQSGSDLFADRRTAPDIEVGFDSGRVTPVDSGLKGDDPSLTSAPSSIFTGERIPDSIASGSGGPSSDSVRIGRPGDDEDAAVEFSDHPTADSEASSAASVQPRAPLDRIDFDRSKKAPPEPHDSQDSGRVDWGSPLLVNEDEATLGIPHSMLEDSPSGILGVGDAEEIAEHDSTVLAPIAKNPAAPKPTKGDPTQAAQPVSDGSDPSVEIDWMAGSSSEAPLVAAEVYEQASLSKPKIKKETKESERLKKRGGSSRDIKLKEPKKSSSGWIGGTLVGMVVAGGAFAGLYFGGVLPNGDKETGTAPSTQIQQRITPNETVASTQNKVPATAAPQTVADARAALEAGDPAKALKVLDAVKAASPDKVTAEAKAAAGQARLFAKVQSLGSAAFAANDDPELSKAREDLEAVIADVDARKTPEGERAVARAAIHLGLTYELANDRKKAREVYESAIKTLPAQAALFQAALDRLSATEAASGTPQGLAPADLRQLLFAAILLQNDAITKDEQEAGTFFWRAANLAAAGKYGDAVEELKKAKTAHRKQARVSIGRGLNPLSDPLEQIFPKCCDDLKAYWELLGSLYANKPIAELVKNEGPEKAFVELAAARVKAMEAVKLATELKEATDKVARAEKDLKDAQSAIAVKEKDYVAKIAQEREAIVKAEQNYSKADQSRKQAEELIASLAKELQSAKLLPEKFDPPALLAAQKSATERATGPTLAVLVSPGTMSIGGAGLAAGQLLDLAERLTKSESASKLATEKLLAETKRLTEEREAEVKKLKDEHAANVKKLTDDYATETKKLMDTYASSSAKSKEDHIAEVKKMSEKFAGDLKALTDGYEGKIKNLEAAVAKEKANGEDVAAKLRLDFGNAMTPAKALDLWLPQLTELRRAADATPALANAKLVLSSANPDSEDAAKAHAVAGMALLLKGNTAEAKEEFEAARATAAYKAAKGKEWVRVADVGLASISDPVAAYRMPVEKPKRDARVASRMLDLGIGSYRSSKYREAEAALLESVQADPTNPLAWYFLGASRWALGAVAQAKEDFRQGGEWEKKSSALARSISEALEPIQGPARDALSIARP